MKICSRCVVQTDNLNFVRFCHAPLKNLARENVNNLEWRKRACATSCRPVNPTVNLVISRVRRAGIVSCSNNRNVALFIEE